MQAVYIQQFMTRMNILYSSCSLDNFAAFRMKVSLPSEKRGTGLETPVVVFDLNLILFTLTTYRGT